MILRQEIVSSLCNPPTLGARSCAYLTAHHFFVADLGRSEAMTEEPVFIERQISHYGAVLKLDLNAGTRANALGLLAEAEQSLTKATVAARDFPVVCRGGISGWSRRLREPNRSEPPPGKVFFILAALHGPA
jgi:hypothetical protein